MMKFFVLFLLGLSLIGNVLQWKMNFRKIKTISNIKRDQSISKTRIASTAREPARELEKIKRNTLTRKKISPEKEEAEHEVLVGKKKIDPEKQEEEHEALVEKQKKAIEQFVISDLNLNLEFVNLILATAESAKVSFRNSISQKSEDLSKKYKEGYGYMFDPDDYILLGQSRLRARESIKALIGSENFKRFLQFIQDYNHGKYSESFIPIGI